jgi:polyketide biosynthesis enoyl-CoA hydratase PksI
MMAQSVIEVREHGSAVIHITMQDRANKNTFSPELIGGLVEAFASVNQNHRCKVVILSGYDSYFASGGTQDSLLALHEGKIKFTDGPFYTLPLECKVPVISAMQGHEIGGGFIFGLFGDFIVLSRESVYTTNFMKYGFTPGMGATCVLPKKLGMPLAEEMLIGARSYRGAELEKRGVPFPVLPRVEVIRYAYELASDIADKPAVSLTQLKAHLTMAMREELPRVIEQELAMHELTFHQPEVKERIYSVFGK